MMISAESRYALLAHAPAGLTAVDVGQVDIEQDQVGARVQRPGARPPRRSVGLQDRREFLVQLQLFGQGGAQVVVVVDDEDGLVLSHGADHAPLR